MALLCIQARGAPAGTGSSLPSTSLLTSHRLGGARGGGLGVRVASRRVARQGFSFRVDARDGRADGEEPRPGSGGDGEKVQVDWDRAWSSFRQQRQRSGAGAKSFLQSLMPDMEKYVSRTPPAARSGNYPIREETDPLKRSERAFLDKWTDTRFTLAIFGLAVSLLVYMAFVVGPPPS